MDGVNHHWKHPVMPQNDKDTNFFIFEGNISEYLDSECVLEQDPLARLAQEGQLAAYRHHGFWQPMDTLRESVFLNELWSSDEAPWKNW